MRQAKTSITVISMAERRRSISSMPKPYDPADMVKAVAYLLRHLKGDETLSPPYNLEVFDSNANDLVPDAI